VIVLAAVLITIPAVYLVVEMDTSYDMIAAMPNTESKQGVMAASDAFGQGKILPTYVLLSMANNVSNGGILDQAGMNAIENVSSEIASMDNVKQVISPTRPDGEGKAIDYQNLSAYPADEAAQYLLRIQSMIGQDGKAIRISVILEAGPYTSTSMDSVKEIRSVLSTFVGGNEISSGLRYRQHRLHPGHSQHHTVGLPVHRSAGDSPDLHCAHGGPGIGGQPDTFVANHPAQYLLDLGRHGVGFPVCAGHTDHLERAYHTARGVPRSGNGL